MAGSHLEVVNEMVGEVTQLAIENGFSSSLQQQQLVKGLKDVNAGLVDGAHYGAACVHNVAYCAHHNGSRSSIQTYTAGTHSSIKFVYCLELSGHKASSGSHKEQLQKLSLSDAPTQTTKRCFKTNVLNDALCHATS